MTAHSRHLSIVEAVETLSSIADLEFDRGVGIAQKHEVVLGSEKVAYKTVHWLHEDDPSSTVNLVRETFRVILHYLRQFYSKEYGQVTDQNTLEGIKTVMVLVGEAAKKLDKYTEIFHQSHSVTEFREYKQLQEFYRSKIARKIGEGALGDWTLGLISGKLDKSVSFKAVPKKADRLTDTKHVFVDLEAVKRDAEYELFFIRKEDGSRFFSPRLLRNIKLVCDFGSYFGERKELDPLSHVKEWQDRVCHVCAREILKAVGSHADCFFRQPRRAHSHPLEEAVAKALFALMLASHAQNLLRYHPVKSCAEYFEDFQTFLREALQADNYRRWLVYPPKENNKPARDLIEMVHLLCRTFYVGLRGLEDIKPMILGLILESTSQTAAQESANSKKIWSRLLGEYAAMSKLLRHHQGGPLLKVIEMLGEDAFHAFDSIMQHNLPHQLYDLYTQEKRVAFLRIPAPIYQEFINKALVNDEFKGLLRSYGQGTLGRKHLLINLQDRTSWREYVRCLVLEELQYVFDMEGALDVVTLATDTDFYHQLAPYHQLHHAQTFKVQFKDLLLDANAGYFFPRAVNRSELSLFIDQTFEAIHRIFFSSKNVLSRENRLDFIEIFYMFLQLKLIDWLQPTSISLTCKDGIDTGEAYSTGIFIFLKLMSSDPWTETDWEHVNFMLYAPALLMRERVMLAERFNRMVSALRMVENARSEFGADNFSKIIQEGFVRTFRTPILQAQILLPR